MTKTNEMTFTPEALKAVLDQAVAEAVAAALGNAAKVPANKLVDGRTEASLKWISSCCKAFKRAGYGDVTPVGRDDVQQVAGLGHKVKPGEKATKVRQFRLFTKHRWSSSAFPRRKPRHQRLRLQRSRKPRPPPRQASCNGSRARPSSNLIAV